MDEHGPAAIHLYDAQMPDDLTNHAPRRVLDEVHDVTVLEPRVRSWLLQLVLGQNGHVLPAARAWQPYRPAHACRNVLAPAAGVYHVLAVLEPLVVVHDLAIFEPPTG